MIIWLASYPKSGNTYVRAFLSAYYFSENGEFDFSQIAKIDQFPHEKFFKQKANNIYEASKQWIPIQKEINKDKRIRFFKTHSFLGNYQGNQFTSPETTLGAIYIVRDPRNVVISQSHHYGISIDDSTELMINNKRNIGSSGFQTFVGSWNFNLNSWKQFDAKFCLIKYEDLVNDTEKTFLKILKFIAHLGRVKFTYDKDKFRNTLETTNFKNMQKMETSETFVEAKEDAKTGEKIKFFNLGIKNDWEKLLNKEIRASLEKELENEMKELNYLK